MCGLQQYFQIWNHSPVFKSLSQFLPSNLAWIIVNSSLMKLLITTWWIYWMSLLLTTMTGREEMFQSGNHTNLPPPRWHVGGSIEWIIVSHWWIIVIIMLSFYWLPLICQTLCSALHLHYLLRSSRILDPLSRFFRYRTEGYQEVIKLISSRTYCYLQTSGNLFHDLFIQ